MQDIYILRKMKYFRFIDITYSEGQTLSFFDRIIVYFLHKICRIPKANPDFENVYAKVATWYIEYDEVNGYTSREIGLDKDGKVIVKGPYKANLGFWVDNDLTINDYADRFDIQYTDQAIFETLWKDYIG